jgi:hypothetical protein
METKNYELIFNDGTKITSVEAENQEKAENYFVEYLYDIFQEMDPKAEWSQKDHIRNYIKNDYVIEVR